MTERKPIELCGKAVYQNNSRIRCVLKYGHQGDCEPQRFPHKLRVSQFSRKVEHLEEDPNYKEVSRGDGMIYAVPTWIAEVLERHKEEIDE